MRDTTVHDAHEASGERFVPELMGGELIEAEHQARYRLALPFVEGKRVLDAGCGTGWGSELLVRAGARQVVGVDIADEAVEDSRKRVDEAVFLRGDLQDLPFRPGSFDVVVCFEALEHTLDTSRTLANLTDVLAEDGILFVSSPNPGVYPAGNPFHFHEVPPEQLQEEVGSRLPSVVLFRQYLNLASTLYQDGAGGAAFSCSSYAVRPMTPGNDPYSVVVGSRAPLPPIGPAQALAPSEQLQNLDALAAALADERQALFDDHARIAAERKLLLEELSDARRRLSAAGTDLAAVMAERDSAVTQATEAHNRATRAESEAESAVAERDSATARAGEADGRAGRAAAELDAALGRLGEALRRLEWVGGERDRFAVALVQAEQKVAAWHTQEDRSEDVTPEDSQLRSQLDALRLYAGQLEQELEATRATVSWRITRPLRDIRARTFLRRRA